jgi:hypothetical protein
MTPDQFGHFLLLLVLVVSLIKLSQRFPKFASIFRVTSSAHAELETSEPRIAELRLSIQLIDGIVLQKDVEVTSPAILRRGEFIIHQTQGYLLEYVEGPTQFQSGSTGVSFGIGGSVRMNVGGTQGQIQRGQEALTAIDQGYIVFTSQRIIFAGARESREWTLSKISTAQGIEDRSGFMLGYSALQRLEGLKSLGADPLVWALEAATALSQDDKETAKSKIHGEIARLAAPQS